MVQASAMPQAELHSDLAKEMPNVIEPPNETIPATQETIPATQAVIELEDSPVPEEPAAVHASLPSVSPQPLDPGVVQAPLENSPDAHAPIVPEVPEVHAPIAPEVVAPAAMPAPPLPKGDDEFLEVSSGDQRALAKASPDDAVVPTRPPPPKLTRGAIKKWLWRLVQPKASGKFKVPKEVVDEYRDERTRGRVEALFEKSGYQRDSQFQKKVLLSTA